MDPHCVTRPADRAHTLTTNTPSSLPRRGRCAFGERRPTRCRRPRSRSRSKFTPWVSSDKQPWVSSDERCSKPRCDGVGHHLRQDDVDVVALRRLGERVGERVVRDGVGPQQELPLRASARDEQKLAREHRPRSGHALAQPANYWPDASARNHTCESLRVSGRRTDGPRFGRAPDSHRARYRQKATPVGFRPGFAHRPGFALKH
jgi:hypothetical protein